MISYLDRFDLPRMSRPQLEQALAELNQDRDELTWDIEWRTKELGALEADLQRLQVLIGRSP